MSPRTRATDRPGRVIRGRCQGSWKYLQKKWNYLIGPRKPLDWHARTFSEKIRWRCQHPDPRVDYSTWVDKYKVKNLVGAIFNVANTYLVVHDPKDIDADRLPRTFVMKATHGWNMSLLVENGIVQASNQSIEDAGRIADSRYLQQMANNWMNSGAERKRQRQERQYRQVTPGIFFEQSLVPVDYEVQLFLFNGRFRFAMVFYRDFYHTMGRHRLYDENWRRLAPGTDRAALRYEQSKDEIVRPPNAALKNLASLCQSIDHVRADFYVRGGEYYFGEFTFTHGGGGYGPGLIGKYDADLGRFWSR